ncbi:hypothetical protein ABPG72_008093 [Tetrahymena utriculariae]
MANQNLEQFKSYLYQYRYEENEYIQSMFLERSFKYVELEYKDSFTKNKIVSFPVYSALCINKQTAAICLYDISTIFNILFPTQKEKDEFEYLITTQTAACPCCNEQISFNFLIYDSFLASFHEQISKKKNQLNEVPILRLEKIRNQSSVKYNLVNNQQIEYQGVVKINEKVTHFSIDQYQRMQHDLEKEIDQLQEKKDQQSKESKEQIESEIKLRQTIQNIIADEHNRKPDEPSTYLKQEQPFRILKIGQGDGSEYKSVQNTKIYFFANNKLYIGQSQLQLLKRFQIFDLFIKRDEQTITPFNMYDDEFKDFKSLLIYDTIVLIVTASKVYSLQLIKGYQNESDKNQLLVEEIYQMQDENQNQQRVPQICFIKDNLYLLDYQEDTQTLIFKCIRDLLIYPEFQDVSQPQVYLEISDSSKNEKVLLLIDDFAQDIILLTPDQYFIYDIQNNSWQEKDLQLQKIHGVSDKLNFKYYDYHQDEEYSGKGKKIQQNYGIPDNSYEEQKNVYFIDDSDDSLNNELDIEDILENIFENSHQIKVINNKQRKFLLLNIEKGYIYKLDLRNREKNQMSMIDKIECIINFDISSQNIVYKDKKFFYAIKIEQKDTVDSDNQNDFQGFQDLELQLEEELKLYNIVIPGFNSNSEIHQSPFYKSSVLCRDFAIFQVQKFG